MKSGVYYYWQAADRVVMIHAGRLINILSEKREFLNHFGTVFIVEKCRSEVAKLKTLVYLGDL